MTTFDRRRLVGTWELLRWFVTDPDGTEREPLWAGARGLLVFTDDGWATIMVTAADRPGLSRRDPRGAPVEQRAAAFDGLASYCCRWRVVGTTVELLVLLAHNPAMVGTVQVRGLEMRGRTLTVFSEERVEGGTRVHRLRWRPALAPRGPFGRRRAATRHRKDA